MSLTGPWHKGLYNLSNASRDIAGQTPAQSACPFLHLRHLRHLRIQKTSLFVTVLTIEDRLEPSATDRIALMNDASFWF